MRLIIDAPIHDLVNDRQAQLNGKDATLRTAIVYIGCMPSPRQARGEQEDLGTISALWAIAARAAALPDGDALELDISEAAILKTRAFETLLPMLAGQLSDALEKAANS